MSNSNPVRSSLQIISPTTITDTLFRYDQAPSIMTTNYSEILQHLHSLLLLNDCFVLSEDSFLDFVYSLNTKKESCKNSKLRCLVVLLLLISGNVQPNPGPHTGLRCLQTPLDFKSSPGLGIVHFNARSLVPKMDLIRIWAETTDADIIVISETWLSKSVPDKDIHILGYNVSRTDRPKKGGGVAIYSKTKFRTNVLLSESVCKRFEMLALKIEVSKDCLLTVVGCYRPPSALSDTLESFAKCMAKLNYNEVVIVGDFNWDWLKPISDDFKGYCYEMNLTQLLNAPTRPNLKYMEKSTLIDLVLTNAPHKYIATGIFVNDVSDHCAIAAIRNIKVPKTKSRFLQKRNFKHLSEQGFLHDIYYCDWKRISLIPDVEMAWSFFREIFLSITNKHAPVRTYRIKGRENPWFSDELAKLIHERNQVWAMARRTNSESDWLKFRSLRNKCTHFTKKEKSDFYLASTTENLNNPFKFWKAIKSLNANCNYDLPPCVTKGSEMVTDRAEMLNCFNDHFVSSGSLFETVSSSVNHTFVDEDVRNGQSFAFSPFTVAEVHKALKGIDPKKAAGPDNLDPYLLNLTADVIAEPLTYLFNLTLELNVIPSVWKSAYVLPLLKGGEPSLLNNYRPISKLSVLAKVLETLVCNQMKEFLCDNNILSTFQSGFRKQHGTITAAMKVVNDLIDAMDRKQHCVSLFIDLSKAFDTVDHDIMLKRLVNIGLSNQAVSWFKDYLSDRTQCVQFDGKSSAVLTVQKGVPQGSVLGPLLFTIYINNVGKNVPKASFHFYADDTVIYCCAATLKKAFDELQTAFTMVQAQLYQLKLVLNTDKTKLMVFTKSKKEPQTLPHIITTQGKEIERVSTYKYLGFLIDDCLTFKFHIDALVKKLRLKLGFYFRNRACFSFEARKRLVSTTFLSVIDYGDILYMHAPVAALRTLDTVYHGALRFVTNYKSQTHHCTLYMRVGWPSLTLRRLSHWYLFIYKAILRQLPSYLCTFIALQYNNNYRLRSQNSVLLTVPKTRTEFGKKAFQLSAPLAWNELQRTMKLQELVSLNNFKARVKVMEENEMQVCKCFDP